MNLKGRRRFSHIAAEDLPLLRALDEVDVALGDSFERDLRAWHREDEDDMLNVLHPQRAVLECELGADVDYLAGAYAAQLAVGTGGGRYRRPRMVPDA